MRLGVLDVGSNTVHLLIVDAHRGAQPLPASKEKTELRLAELLDGKGRIVEEGARDLVRAVASAVEHAEDRGCAELLAFATSAIRDAPNGDAVIARVREETGVDLVVLDGADEARLTFLAVRRWFGWSAGRLMVLDIGGGSLEVAVGVDEAPDAAVSLPLGAGRLQRAFLPTDPPDRDELRALRKYVRNTLAERIRELTLAGVPERAVGTSKTFRSLARIEGAAPYGAGPYIRRVLTVDGARELVTRLSRTSVRERSRLPGVSPGRAAQMLSGAVVAEAALDLIGVTELELCPWALREGLILRRLDQLDPV